MTKFVLSPISRISGHLSVAVQLEGDKITAADCSGDQFRGFEAMLKGHEVTDAIYFTQRICGICSMAHGYTAARLVGKIYDLELAPEVLQLQQALLAAEFLQNHLRHFYLLALPDYLGTEALGEFNVTNATRFNFEQQKRLIKDQLLAVDYSQKCHAMIAIFSGKIPHQHGLVAGGVSVAPTADRKLQFLSLLDEVTKFINNYMIPDAYLLAETYPDYFALGIRPARFLSFGLFDPLLGGHFPAGVYQTGNLEPLQLENISESQAFSWYETTPTSESLPDPTKPGAYSWVKAPRYQNFAYEGGPLARKIIREKSAGKETCQLGTMGRLLARVEEAALLAAWIKPWINSLPERLPVLATSEPVNFEALQANDAPRGPLLHYTQLSGSQINSYSIITPSTWNFSTKDEFGQPGPVEEALLETKITDTNEPVEIGRIIRAFDPCLTCAAHVITSTNHKFEIPIWN